MKSITALSLAVLLLFASALAWLAALDLPDLGIGQFTVEDSATTAAFSQTEDALFFVYLGRHAERPFAEQDWHHYDSFGLRMAPTDGNPGLSCKVEFHDADLKIISRYQGNTMGLNLVPSVVMLGLSPGG